MEEKDVLLSVRHALNFNEEEISDEELLLLTKNTLFFARYRLQLALKEFWNSVREVICNCKGVNNGRERSKTGIENNDDG